MQKGEKSMHYFILCKKESRKVITIKSLLKSYSKIKNRMCSDSYD